MQHDRRNFLTRCGYLASLAALASAFPGSALARAAAYPFRLGVASGSPTATGVVLWTRLLPDPLDASFLPPVPYLVQWELAADEGFRRIVAKGKATALPELAHSVHVEVEGLTSGRWYWYRFMLGPAVSPVGRTRTAPPLESMPSSMRFAFASCQNWEFGQYGAHRHIAAAAPDLVAFLGDYIYEWGPYELEHPDAPRRRVEETLALSDYRARYAQYKSDPHLQAAHHAAPWIVTWDDHEVANDYGNDRDEKLNVDFLQRRVAAYQAFYEHMPVRLRSAHHHDFKALRIYDRYDWGRLARFHLLDNRQYRSYQACPRPGRGGSNTIGPDCEERQEAARSLLGPKQEAWLHQGLASSGATWNILAQQTLMAQLNRSRNAASGDTRWWSDGWDGYPASRERLFDALLRHRPRNPLVISGDVHAFFAADLMPDFDRPASAANPVVATEFCGTSVTSGARAGRLDQYLAQNPHIKYGRSDRRGFAMVELRPHRAEIAFLGLEDVWRADSRLATLAAFTVEDGKAGVGH